MHLATDKLVGCTIPCCAETIVCRSVAAIETGSAWLDGDAGSPRIIHAEITGAPAPTSLA